MTGSAAEAQSSALPSIAAFPRGTTSYTDCFNDSLQAQGARVIDGIYSGRWFLTHAAEIDAFHFHWPSFMYFKSGETVGNWRRLIKFAVFLVYFRMRGKHVFWTAHNLYPHDGGRDLRVHRAGRLLMRLLATRVFVHGAAAADIVHARLAIARRKLSLIEHGHWINYYLNSCSQSEARAQLGLQQASCVFLFIGICKPYKNLEYLIDTFQALPDGPTLVIAGKFQSSVYRERVEQLIARKPRNIQLHARFIADDELQVFLNAANCVVLPYSEILTSGSAMLALSFGKPVIAPRLGCLVELIKPECGLLYDSERADGLHDAMQAFNAERFSISRILEQARGFSWERSAATLIEACRR